MAENDEDVWRKLSSFDKVCHKNWKARKAGYEELLKEIPTYALGKKNYPKNCSRMDFRARKSEKILPLAKRIRNRTK